MKTAAKPKPEVVLMARALEQLAAILTNSNNGVEEMKTFASTSLANQKRQIEQSDEALLVSERHRAECEKTHGEWNRLAHELRLRIEALEARILSKESWEP